MAVDVAAAMGTDEYMNWPVPDKTPVIHHREKNHGFCGYRHHGRLDNGVHVVEFFDNGGGSGVFTYLFFVRFEIAEGFEPDQSSNQIRKYSRLLMNMVGWYGLGDRDNGEIKVLSDRVVVGKSRYRAEDVVLFVDR